MLKLLVADFDICRISKALSKQRLKLSIMKSTIIIDSDEISDDVAKILVENATIISAQNYPLDDSDTVITAKENSKGDNETTDELPGEEPETISTCESDTKCDTFTEKTTDDEVGEENKSVTDKAGDETREVKVIVHPEQQTQKRLKQKHVYRGEVYKWGSIRNDDTGKEIKECVIIIQNDYQNSVSDEMIALFCTNDYEKRAPINFSFQLIKGNMIDHNAMQLQSFNRCNFFVSCIKGINLNMLGKYLGTMTDQFMNTLQPAINYCLDLKRKPRTVERVQLEILSNVSMEDLFKISESNVNDERKVEKFLELFGFDMSLNGMEYVKDSILIARKLNDYTLKILAETIANRKHIETDEVLRIIVARIKERFNLKKSPTVSFIRLIEGLLKKG